MEPPNAREIFAEQGEVFGEGPSIDHVEDRVLPDGVRVRMFANASDQPRAAVIYFHGGGWVLGSVATHDALCRRIAAASGCCVVSVDYSLSPEHRYPKALEDCYSATCHVARFADQFAVDGDRIAVVGDSAGGNLAAAVAIRARDEGGPPIRLQVLVYPVIAPAFDSESYLEFAEGHGLSRVTMQWFWQQYLGDGLPDHLAAPSMTPSLAGLPPAHVITAEYDVLRDEGEKYARRLSDSGVPTTLKRYDGNLHGFVHFAGAFDDGILATNELAHVIKSKLS